MTFGVVDFPLGSGIDTSVDEKLLPADKLTDVVNLFVDKVGQLRKRYGYTTLTKSTLDLSQDLADIDTDDLSSGKSLSALDNALLLQDTTAVHSYSKALDKWNNEGGLLPWRSSVRFVRDISVEIVVDPLFIIT